MSGGDGRGPGNTGLGHNGGKSSGNINGSAGQGGHSSGGNSNSNSGAGWGTTHAPGGPNSPGGRDIHNYNPGQFGSGGSVHGGGGSGNSGGHSGSSGGDQPSVTAMAFGLPGLALPGGGSLTLTLSGDTLSAAVADVMTLLKGSFKFGAWGIALYGILPSEIAKDDPRMMSRIVTSLPADTVTSTQVSALPLQQATVNVTRRVVDVVKDERQHIAIVAGVSVNVPVVNARPTKRPGVFSVSVPGLPDLQVTVAKNIPASTEPAKGLIKDNGTAPYPVGFSSGGNTRDVVIRFPEDSRQKPVYLSVTDVMTPVQINNRQDEDRRRQQAWDVAHPEDAAERDLEAAQVDLKKNDTDIQLHRTVLAQLAEQVKKAQEDVDSKRRIFGSRKVFVQRLQTKQAEYTREENALNVVLASREQKAQRVRNAEIQLNNVRLVAAKAEAEVIARAKAEAAAAVAKAKIEAEARATEVAAKAKAKADADAQAAVEAEAKAKAEAAARSTVHFLSSQGQLITTGYHSGDTASFPVDMISRAVRMLLASPFSNGMVNVATFETQEFLNDVETETLEPFILAVPATLMTNSGDVNIRADSKTVALPVRASLVENNGRFTLALRKTTSISSAVSVLSAVSNSVTGMDEVRLPSMAGAPQLTVLINPVYVPQLPKNTGNQGVVPSVPSHTGTTDEPVESLTVTTIPMDDDVSFRDFIYWQPDADGSGAVPIYVVLSTDPRKLPGKVSGYGQGDGDNWLRDADKGEGVPVPARIADRLRGREFSSFDAFRKALWTEVGKDPELLKQFSPDDVELVNKGYSPTVSAQDSAGKRVKMELHHKQQISKGGDVYNVDNLNVLTPKRHIEIHKGK